MIRPLRLLAPLLIGLSALLAAGVARADGEAGLVIQHGDGNVDTYCVPFKGDAISGVELLKAVSIPVARVGDAVCALGNEGVLGASDYDSCWGPSGRYWAYFSARYGQPWVYSAVGFALLKSKDGEMQAWRWGVGGPNSAPPPPAISFEAVCGHAPRGGLAPATQPPPATSTLSTAAQPGAAAATDTPPSPTVLITATAAPGVTPSALPSSEPTATASVSITAHGTATATVAPAAPLPGTNPGGGQGGLLLFGAAAAVMLAAISGALVWRRSHGA